MRLRTSFAGSIRARRAGLLLVAALVLPAAGARAADEAAAETVGSGRGIAVLPLLNRTGEAVPVGRVRDALVARLADRGFPILDRLVLEKFMRRYRMRYTGGIDQATARALRAETGARTVLITSLDLYEAGDPPKVGLTSRLVATGEVPWILWMDSAVESGDESPGLLGLGLITDREVVLDRVVTRLIDSLTDGVRGSNRGAEGGAGENGKSARRFRPKIAYASPDAALTRSPRGRIAVLPFSNASATRYAGEILTDQIVRHLVTAGGVVIEPGAVRQTMLRTRQIQPQGPSVPQVDVLRTALDVEALIYGEVAHYREAGGGNPQPVLGFSLRAVDTASRQVIWSSVSHTEGDDGVFFFDVGQVATAYQLASELARAIVLALRQDGFALSPEAGIARQILAELAVAGRYVDEMSRRLEVLLGEASQRSQELEAALAAAAEENASLARGLETATEQIAELEKDLATSREQSAALAGLLATAQARSEELASAARAREERLAETTAPGARPAGTAEQRSAEVEAAVRTWAEAWSGQRVDAYLRSYASAFQPEEGLERAAWEAQRRVRLSRPWFIELRLESLRVELTEPDRARASFRQIYRSDRYADVVDKTLELVREVEEWKILRERAR